MEPSYYFPLAGGAATIFVLLFNLWREKQQHVHISVEQVEIAPPTELQNVVNAWGEGSMRQRLPAPEFYLISQIAGTRELMTVSIVNNTTQALTDASISIDGNPTRNLTTIIRHDGKEEPGNEDGAIALGTIQPRSTVKVRIWLASRVWMHNARGGVHFHANQSPILRYEHFCPRIERGLVRWHFTRPPAHLLMIMLLSMTTILWSAWYVLH